MATGDSYPSLSYAFRVGVATVCNIIRETCKALWEMLVPLVMKVPTEEELLQFSKDFCDRWSLPNCVGAIDGKHVIIQAPQQSGSTYFNYKKTFSIVLLAVCNANYMFTYVDIGSYGSQCDSGILNRSAFGKQLMNNSFNMPPPQKLLQDTNDVAIPFYFVGDEAFPLRINLMRPFSKPRNGTMSRDERIFNYRLSRSRRTIENTFGIMVARFRIFHRVINASPDSVDNIIKAAVCLHNFIRLENNHFYFQDSDVDRDINGKFISGRWRDELPNDGVALKNLNLRLGSRNAASTALEIRNYVKDYVNGPGAFLAPWQWEVIDRTN